MKLKLYKLISSKMFQLILKMRILNKYHFFFCFFYVRAKSDHSFAEKLEGRAWFLPWKFKINFQRFFTCFYIELLKKLFWALRHKQSIENQNMVIVLSQCYDVAFRSDLQTTTSRHFHLKRNNFKFLRFKI